MPSLAAETEQVSQCQHHQGAGKAPGPAGAGTSPGHSGDTFRHRPRPAHCHQPRGPPGIEESREHRVGCCSLRVK